MIFFKYLKEKLQQYLECVDLVRCTAADSDDDGMSDSRMD